LGAAAGFAQPGAAGSSVEQGLAGAFRALDLLSVPDMHGAAGAECSPRLAQLPLQQQPGSDLAPSGGTAAAAGGLQILVAPALHTSVDHIQQQHQHQRASSAPTLASSRSYGLLSSSPTPQQQQQQQQPVEVLMHQPGQQSLPQLLGTVGRQDSGAASSCSSGSGLPVLQGVPAGVRQAGLDGQAIARTSAEMHALRTGCSLSDGYMPAAMPASAAVLRLQGLPQQQAGSSRLSVSIPGSSTCSSPISLPVASLSPDISPMSAASVGVDGMMGTMMQPAAYSTATMTNNSDVQQHMLHMQQLQRLQLQQQQQHSVHVVGVPFDSLSPAHQAQLQIMQQQQYGVACIPQQMMAVQVSTIPVSIIVVIQDLVSVYVYVFHLSSLAADGRAPLVKDLFTASMKRLACKAMPSDVFVPPLML
jgi:hypothetical protein